MSTNKAHWQAIEELVIRPRSLCEGNPGNWNTRLQNTWSLHGPGDCNCGCILLPGNFRNSKSLSRGSCTGNNRQQNELTSVFPIMTPDIKLHTWECVPIRRWIGWSWTKKCPCCDFHWTRKNRWRDTASTKSHGLMWLLCAGAPAPALLIPWRTVPDSNFARESCGVSIVLKLNQTDYTDGYYDRIAVYLHKYLWGRF